MEKYLVLVKTSDSKNKYALITIEAAHIADAYWSIINNINVEDIVQITAVKII